MAIHDTDLARAGPATEHHSDSRWVSRCEGASSIALGMSAAALVTISPLTVPSALGWLVFAGGMVRVAGVTADPSPPLYWSQGIGATAAIVCGLGLAAGAPDGEQVRSFLAALFAAECVSSLAAVALMRPVQSGGWGLALAGLLDLTMTGCLVAGWPGGCWAPGMLAALDLLAIGVAMLLL